MEPLARYMKVSGRKILAAGASALVAGAAWTQIGRRHPTLRHYTVEVDAQLPPVRILQIADPHFYPAQEFLVDFVSELAKESFDLVVATGDNLGSARGFELLQRAFAPLLERPGAFVFGSNDYYSPHRKRWSSYLLPSSKPRAQRDPDLPWREMAEFFSAAGWIDLRNNAEIVEAGSSAVPVGLLGVDDPHINRDRIPDVPPGWQARPMYRVGVTHAPYRRVLDEYTSIGVDAIIAGHTHGGQLCVPGYGALVTNCDLPREFASGLNTWTFGGRSAALHVSAGLGNSPYAPVRFACRPEASIIELRPRK